MLQKTRSRQVQRSVRSHQHYQQREVRRQDPETSQEEENQEGNQNPGKPAGRNQCHHVTSKIMLPDCSSETAAHGQLTTLLVDPRSIPVLGHDSNTTSIHDS